MMLPKVKMFSFLSCNSERYTFLKFPSNPTWSFMVHKSAIKPRIVIKSAGSEPMRIPVIYPKDKLPKSKKQLSRRK